MVEPQKPFACTIPDCGMTFTNEDHLHVHVKKHDMVLQLGPEQRAAFVADQTPTPTRFIRNCEEVGLFQDLVSVNDNPFDEGFKRAMQEKISLETPMPPTPGDLHTPHFPTDSTLYTESDVIISRSLSDETGAKEYETTTISKLTNEVTTISRVVANRDFDKITDDVTVKINETVKDNIEVYKNITVHSNVEIRKDGFDNRVPVLTLTDAVKNAVNNDSLLNKVTDKIPPIMSQKSLDFVVDSLTSDMNEVRNDSVKCKEIKINKPCVKKEKTAKPNEDSNKNINDNYEVIIKFPNGKRMRMQAVEETKPDTKEILKQTIEKKLKTPVINTIVPNVVQIPTGTLIPVTLVNPNAINLIPANNISLKVPISKNAMPHKNKSLINNRRVSNKNSDVIKTVARTKESMVSKDSVETIDITSDCVIDNSEKRSLRELGSRSAASKRYRDRLKHTMLHQAEENRLLKETNQKLIAETAVLKLLITEHMRRCPDADDLRKHQEHLSFGGNSSLL